MEKQLKYSGEFLSRAGVLYRVDLLEDSAQPFEVGALSFPDKALQIEWKGVDKMDVLESSSATLTVYSESDRRFIDLYKVAPGAVRMDVYRAGALYWSGTLDPELYEEPYSYPNWYEVQLTFADFAILGRKNWQNEGIASKASVVGTCLAASGVNFGSIVKHISTSQIGASQAPTDLSDLFDQGANYFDEEGEPLTMMEVLEGSLQPLALKIKQYAGKIYIYDLNSLSKFTPTQFEWDGDDAVLGVDETYNNVTVTFSPYADVTVYEEELDAKTTASDDTLATTIHTDYANDGVSYTSLVGFYFYAGSQADTSVTLGGGAKFFRIDSEFSGSNEAGVAYTAKTFNLATQQYYNIDGLQDAYRTLGGAEPVIMDLPEKHIGSPSPAGEYKLKLKMEMLLDVRYNPFEDAQIENEEGDWAMLNEKATLVSVPFRLFLKDASGSITHYYDNFSAETFDGVWREGQSYPADRPYSWMEYYATSGEGIGVGGWQSNKTYINSLSEITDVINRLGDGDNIPCPPVAGFLHLQVLGGVRITVTMDEMLKIRWLLYKLPSISLIRENGLEVELEDQVLSAWINTDAKEELSIDTISGTMGDLLPTSRGRIYDSANRAITRLYRGGAGGTAEELLVNTAYSQFAGRKNTLSGTVKLMPEFGVWMDKNINGKYMITEQTQEIAHDESEMIAVEVVEDSYKGVVYE